MDVLVIGAGAVGLTTAISLAEAGLSVTIRTAAPPERTTSVAAGAVWGGVKAGQPDRVQLWQAARDGGFHPGASHGTGGVRCLRFSPDDRLLAVMADLVYRRPESEVAAGTGGAGGISRPVGLQQL